MNRNLDDAVGFFRSEFRRLPAAALFREALGVRRRDRICCAFVASIVLGLFVWFVLADNHNFQLRAELQAGLLAESKAEADVPPL